MSLLIYTPTIGDTMQPETRASIEAQRTSIPFDWEVGYHNPFPGEKMRNVVAQYQRAREMTLEGGYDALLTVEHDMIIPPDAIEKLCATNAAVVYGVYMLRHGTPTLNAWQYINNKNLGMSLSLYPEEVRRGFRQGWLEVSGTGWGCTLIRREVLERFQIHSNSGSDAGDITFSTECLRAGFQQIARFDVPCLHILPNGKHLDPRKDGGIVARVLALQTFTARAGRESIPMKKDRYYTIPLDDAHELARAGYVKITNEDDSQQEAGEREQPDMGERELAVDPKARGRSTRSKKAK